MIEEFPKMAELDYRGYHVDFLFDDAGQQAIAEFDNEIISFGAYNTWYKDEMKDIIDRKLDTICDSLNTFKLAGSKPKISSCSIIFVKCHCFLLFSSLFRSIYS